MLSRQSPLEHEVKCKNVWLLRGFAGKLCGSCDAVDSQASQPLVRSDFKNGKRLKVTESKGEQLWG